MKDQEVDPSRSALMSKVRGKDTTPEMAVRRLLHASGYRYRLHTKGLPGRPDVVFSKRRKAIFIHGCFWHRHKGCRKTTTPKTRTEFWTEKFDLNVERDERVRMALEAVGWDVLTIWECETKDVESLRVKLTGFLG